MTGNVMPPEQWHILRMLDRCREPLQLKPNYTMADVADAFDEWARRIAEVAAEARRLADKTAP
jgi:hypothetical protein